MVHTVNAGTSARKTARLALSAICPGARRTFAAGLAMFVVASAACGLAPGIGSLIAARLVQGTAAAVLVPSSLALLGAA
jgi:DHA2 family methylenomycin A resistance protein-like MFS transporter